MLNIIDLEKRWFKYKLKSYIPHIVIILSIFIIILTSLYYFPHSKPVIHQNKVVTPAIETKVTIIDKPLEVIHKEQTQITMISPQKRKAQLSPSLDFMKKMQNSVQVYYDRDVINKEKSQNINHPNNDTQKPKQIQKPVTKPNNTVEKISIKRQNTKHDIHDIIQRFKKNNNPALSLFVAKKYYELGNYKQAYNYSLITNNINKEIEVSWIIFSKSLVKMGKKKQAISTLTKYIKQSHSNSAQILLDEILSGKFK